MNTHAKAGTGTVLLGVVGVAIVALLIYIAFFSGGTVIPNYNLPQVSGGNCEIAPTISPNVVNALSRATAVSPVMQAIVNGQNKGIITSSTTFSKGDKVEVMINASSYLNQKFEVASLDCGTNAPNVDMYDDSTATISIKNDAGTAVLTDAAGGGATNESNWALGGTKNFEMKLTGTDKTSTGELVFVIELAEPANVSSVTISDTTSGAAMTKLSAVPDGLTVSGTNQYRVAFELPAIEGATAKTYNINIAAASAKDISGAVYTTMYSKNYFIDTDGKIKLGVVNLEHATTYGNTYDYDFFVASA